MFRNKKIGITRLYTKLRQTIMLDQIMQSELLVELSTEEQQYMAGGQLFAIPPIPVIPGIPGIPGVFSVAAVPLIGGVSGGTSFGYRSFGGFGGLGTGIF